MTILSEKFLHSCPSSNNQPPPSSPDDTTGTAVVTSGNGQTKTPSFFIASDRWREWKKGRWPISYSSTQIGITPDTGNAIKLPVPLVGYQMCISTAKRIGQYSAPVALQGGEDGEEGVRAEHHVMFAVGALRQTALGV